MQDLKLIKTNKNEQCEKIIFRIVHFLFIRLLFFLLIFRKRLKYNQ